MLQKNLSKRVFTLVYNMGHYYLTEEACKSRWAICQDVIVSKLEIILAGYYGPASGLDCI